MKLMNIIGKQLSGKELFDFIIHNKAEIMDVKKSVIKFTDPRECALLLSRKNVTATEKSYLYENDEKAGIVKRTIVANTYNWLDSHDDVHLPNLFAKSIKERGTRIPHLHDHKFELAAKVGKLTSIEEQDISWKELGADVKGKTMALIVESDIKKAYNEKVYEAYLSDEIDQHSVGMRYVKIDLAINDEDYEDEYKVWKAYIDQIGNQEQAVQQGFFFAVKEAVLIEVSAVLVGSNELTPTLNNKFQPRELTEQKQKPQVRTSNIAELLKSYSL